MPEYKYSIESVSFCKLGGHKMFYQHDLDLPDLAGICAALELGCLREGQLEFPFMLVDAWNETMEHPHNPSLYKVLCDSQMVIVKIKK